jgi:adenylylsulfate kinase
MTDIKLFNQPLTWWLTGLPAAGKTTLAHVLRQSFEEVGSPFAVLDGDEVRQGLCADLDFSVEGRTENIRRVAEVAKIFNLNGISVAVALVSPLQAARKKARQIIGEQRFIEVHVSTPIAVCRQRDPKGLYAKANQTPGMQSTGAGAPYEVPVDAEVVIDTAEQPVSESLKRLLEAAAKKQKECLHD